MGFMDEDMFISTEAENLGTQDINGRPALGYRSKLLGDGAAQIESWFDKATGALMRSKNQNVTYTLTRFTNKIPQSYLFQVPKRLQRSAAGLLRNQLSWLQVQRAALWHCNIGIKPRHRMHIRIVLAPNVFQCRFLILQSKTSFF